VECIAKRSSRRQMREVRDRAWTMMALISTLLSDHSVIKSDRAYRHLVDQARKALFEVYRKAAAADAVARGDRGLHGENAASSARRRGEI
jgi:hypothetical protein